MAISACTTPWGGGGPQMLDSDICDVTLILSNRIVLICDLPHPSRIGRPPRARIAPHDYGAGRAGLSVPGACRLFYSHPIHQRQRYKHENNNDLPGSNSDYIRLIENVTTLQMLNILQPPSQVVLGVIWMRVVQ